MSLTKPEERVYCMSMFHLREDAFIIRVVDEFRDRLDISRRAKNDDADERSSLPSCLVVALAEESISGDVDCCAARILAAVSCGGVRFAKNRALFPRTTRKYSE